MRQQKKYFCFIVLTTEYLFKKHLECNKWDVLEAHAKTYVGLPVMCLLVLEWDDKF